MRADSSVGAGDGDGEDVEWVRGCEFGGGSEREMMGERDV